jgi:outer membrane protein assembly factor BamA
MHMACPWPTSFGVIVVAVASALAQGPKPGSPACTTPSDQIVHLQSVKLTGANRLSAADQDSITALLTGQNFDSCGMTSAVAYRVLDAVRERGYFLARVQDIAVTEVSGAAGDYRDVTLAIRLDEGDLYRLGSIAFAGYQAFPAEQIRAAFPMNPGEIFDTAKLSSALDSLRSLYARRGYLNLTPVPDTEVDRQRHTVALHISIDEGAQYRVRDVRILGLDNDTTQSLMGGWTMPPGKFFNSRLLENFFLEHRSELPAGSTVARNSSLLLDHKDHIVDVTLDFSAGEVASRQNEENK